MKRASTLSILFLASCVLENPADERRAGAFRERFAVGATLPDVFRLAQAVAEGPDPQVVADNPDPAMKGVPSLFAECKEFTLVTVDALWDQRYEVMKAVPRDQGVERTTREVNAAEVPVFLAEEAHGCGKATIGFGLWELEVRFDQGGRSEWISQPVDRTPHWARGRHSRAKSRRTTG